MAKQRAKLKTKLSRTRQKTTNKKISNKTLSKAFFLLLISILFITLGLYFFNKEKIDYFIVLGAGLIGKEVTPLLTGRINKGLEIRNIQGSGKLVFSGGQGPDELIPEGDAMAQ